MSDWKETLYPHLPVSLQNLACGFKGRGQRKLRYGGEFRELLDRLEESQWWPVAAIQGYQDTQLRMIVEHAYRTTPFYRRRFDDLKLRPADIKTTEDLQKLPVLTKEDVRQNFDEMISSEVGASRMVLCHTSGTTGKGLQFYQEPRAIQFRWAVWWRHRQRFAVEFDSPYAAYTGLAAVPLGQREPPFWRENRAMRQTIFTMHHIVPDKVKAIVRRLNEGGFDYYAGYPSIIFVLASLIETSGFQITAPPKMIFTGAENLYENHRRLMRSVFNADVTDEYGFSEGCGNASRCERDVFHEDFEFGILECFQGKSVDRDSRQGRIVATGFASYGMPFIRYDVGDVGTWKDVNCECGRSSKVLASIDGRTEQFVITPEGRKVLRFDYVFKNAHNVRDAQVVQKELGAICLRVVRRPAYSKADEHQLKLEIRDKISAMLMVEFEYVDEIEREPNGKMMAVKSLLDKPLGTSNTAPRCS